MARLKSCPSQSLPRTTYETRFPENCELPDRSHQRCEYFRNGEMYFKHLRSSLETNLEWIQDGPAHPLRSGRQDCLLPLKLSIPARIPLLYVILGVLLAISVLPMYFYSAQIETMNRERLKTNEMLLQNTVTRSLADDISQHQEALHMMLANLSSSIQVMMLANASGNDLNAQKLLTPELRAMLENFVS